MFSCYQFMYEVYKAHCPYLYFFSKYMFNLFIFILSPLISNYLISIGSLEDLDNAWFGSVEGTN